MEFFVEITEFARKGGISISEVWKKVRRGELVARTVNGQFEVYGGEGDVKRAGAEAGPTPEVLIAELAAAVPDPTPDEQPKSELPAVAENPPASTEIALLLDHLSLAKDENREILKMATDTINQMTAITKESLGAKDELVRQSRQEAARLSADCAKKDKEIQTLKQDLEDLQMLVKSLQPR
jgi:hypothetical protein